jgi:predicted RNA-binding Zn-ribbon protein involved in translation (DUF1610 family)
MSVALCSDDRGTMPAAEAPHITRFNCPNCGAIYDLVRTEAVTN